MNNSKLFETAKKLMQMRGYILADNYLSVQGQNELLDTLPNMLFMMEDITSFNMSRDFSILKEVLGKFPMETSEGGKITESKLITPIDYDPNKYIPDANSVKFPEVLQHVYGGTKYKKLFRLPVSKKIIARAFTSQGAFDAFMTHYMQLLEKSMNMWLYRKAQGNTFANIINSEDLGTIKGVSASGGLGFSEQQMLLITIQKYFAKIFDYPKYTENMDGRQRLLIADLSYDKIVIYCSTNTRVQLTSESLSNLFNREDLSFMDKGMFGSIITCDDMPDNCIYATTKGAIQLLQRIEEIMTTPFGNNMMYVTFLHTWWILMTKPWLFGVKIFWDLASDTTSKNGEINFKIDTSKMKVAIANNIATATGIAVTYNATDTADYGALGEFDYFVVQVTDTTRDDNPENEEGMDGTYVYQEYANFIGNSYGAKNDYFAKRDNMDAIEPKYYLLSRLVKGVDTKIFDTSLTTTGFNAPVGKYLVTVAGYINRKRVITATTNIDLTKII